MIAGTFDLPTVSYRETSARKPDFPGRRNNPAAFARLLRNARQHFGILPDGKGDRRIPYGLAGHNVDSGPGRDCVRIVPEPLSTTPSRPMRAQGGIPNLHSSD